MEHLLIIPGRMMGLNEYVYLCRGNKYGASSKKNAIENNIIFYIRQQLRGKKFNKIQLKYTWYESNRKRDLDNISFAQKFVQDALVRSGIIENDGWENIVGFTHDFSVDRKNPRVEIEIIELGEHTTDERRNRNNNT